MPIDAGSIGAVATSLRTAFDITKAMIGIRDAAMMQEKVIELRELILTAQSETFRARDAQAALARRVDELEEKLAKFETWDTEKKKYCLKEVDAGTLAYVIKEDARGSEPVHWLCVNCFDHGRKSLLQERPRPNREAHKIFYCATCKAEIRTDYRVRIGGSLQERRAAAESKQAGELCPSCGKPELRVKESRLQPPPWAQFGAREYVLKCDECGFDDVRPADQPRR